MECFLIFCGTISFLFLMIVKETKKLHLLQVNCKFQRSLSFNYRNNIFGLVFYSQNPLKPDHYLQVFKAKVNIVSIVVTITKCGFVCCTCMFNSFILSRLSFAMQMLSWTGPYYSSQQASCYIRGCQVCYRQRTFLVQIR